MIQQEELIKKIEEEGLNAYEVRQTPKINDNTIVLKEISDIIRFCKINDIKNLFFNYIYLDKDEYIIDDELQQDIEKDIYKLIKKEIKEHNKRVEAIDFTRPVMLNISTIFQNNLVCILESDYWYEDINLLNAEETIEYLQENYEYILEEKKIEEQENRFLLKNELREYMLNDDMFKICTNKDLRKNYAQTIIKDKKMNKYLKAFISEASSSLINQEVFMFVEVVWAEYKNFIKNKSRGE